MTLECSVDDNHPLELYVLNEKGYTVKHYSGEKHWINDPSVDMTFFKESVTLNEGYYYINISKNPYDWDVVWGEKIGYRLSLTTSLVKKPAFKKIKRKGRTKAVI